MIVDAGAPGIDRVEGLWREMVEHHRQVVGGTWPVRDSGDAWERRRAQYAEWIGAGTAWMLLAVPAEDRGGAPEGYAVVGIHPSSPSWDIGDRVGELESLVVAEAARGAGIGTLLIAAARDLLHGQGIEYWSVAVVEANAAAERLYERQGFRPYYRQMLAPVKPAEP